MAKKKLKPIMRLKKELDTQFSLFIRLREATEYGLVQCFTCGVARHYKDGMQNGHFQSRKHMATRFDEENCQVQCVKCNMFSQGEQFKFGLNLDGKYYEGKAEELEFLARTTVKFSRSDYMSHIEHYKQLVKELKLTKGIE
tara:strand:+ start:3854 stop:4276 length:423 start_codon:yes stop_codon:yes gene_type:complete